MKKIRVFLLIIFTCFMATSSVKAQIGAFLNSVDEIEFSAGPSLVSLYNNNITKNARQPKVGYTIQLGLIFNMNQRIFLSANLMWERKGLKSRNEVRYYNPDIDSTNCLCTTSIGSAENNTSFDYLTLSLSPRFFLVKELYIGVGPYISRLLKVHGYSKNSWDNKITYNVGNSNTKDIDLGIYLSVGYNLGITDKLRFNIQISDSYGVLNISDTNKTETRTTTNSFALKLGINLKL